MKERKRARKEGRKEQERESASKGDRKRQGEEGEEGKKERKKDGREERHDDRKKLGHALGLLGVVKEGERSHGKPVTYFKCISYGSVPNSVWENQRKAGKRQQREGRAEEAERRQGKRQEVEHGCAGTHIIAPKARPVKEPTGPSASAVYLIGLMPESAKALGSL